MNEAQRLRCVLAVAGAAALGDTMREGEVGGQCVEPGGWGATLLSTPHWPWLQEGRKGTDNPDPPGYAHPGPSQRGRAPPRHPRHPPPCTTNCKAGGQLLVGGRRMRWATRRRRQPEERHGRRHVPASPPACADPQRLREQRCRRGSDGVCRWAGEQACRAASGEAHRMRWARREWRWDGSIPMRRRRGAATRSSLRQRQQCSL